MHEVLVNRLGCLSLPRKSVVRLTDLPDMTSDVYRGRKTTKTIITTLTLRLNGEGDIYFSNIRKTIVAGSNLRAHDLVFGAHMYRQSTLCSRVASSNQARVIHQSLVFHTFLQRSDMTERLLNRHRPIIVHLFSLTTVVI